MTRRGVLLGLAALPAAAPAALARDYTRRDEVMGTIDALSAAAEARLVAIRRAAPGASAFVASARADLVRHRRERGAPSPPTPAALEEPASLPRLRGAVEELMHSHAEGLPALADGRDVARLTAHLVDLSRILTVIDLWIEMEGIE